MRPVPTLPLSRGHPRFTAANADFTTFLFCFSMPPFAFYHVRSGESVMGMLKRPLFPA